MRILQGAEGGERWRTSRLHGEAEEGVKLIGMASADSRSRGVEGGGVVDRWWREGAGVGAKGCGWARSKAAVSRSNWAECAERLAI